MGLSDLLSIVIVLIFLKKILNSPLGIHKYSNLIFWVAENQTG